MKQALLATLLLAICAQAGCTPAEEPPPLHPKYPWMQPWHVETLQRIRAFRPEPTPGMQRECLGRLVFEVGPGLEWAGDRVDKIEDWEAVVFPDEVPGDRMERLVYGDLQIWVTLPATEADMQARREEFDIWDMGSSAEAWERGVRRREKNLADAIAEGADELVISAERRVLAEAREKLEKARHRKRLDFGMPGELSYDDGYGEIRIRFLADGHIYTIVRYHRQLRDGDPRREAMLAELRDVLSRFRTRAPGEVPDEPGVCLPHAFIADDGKEDYHTHASFRYKDRPGVVYSINTGYVPPRGQSGVAWIPEPPQLRVLSYPTVVLKAFTGQARNVHAMRPRGADVGPYRADQGGFSLNAAKPGDPDVRTYTIFTGLQGLPGLQVWPFIQVEAQSFTRMQYPQLARNPPPQAETQQRLDALLKHMHLRPVTVEPEDFKDILDR